MHHLWCNCAFTFTGPLFTGHYTPIWANGDIGVSRGENDVTFFKIKILQKKKSSFKKLFVEHPPSSDCSEGKSVTLGAASKATDTIMEQILATNLV